MPTSALPLIEIVGHTISKTYIQHTFVYTVNFILLILQSLLDISNVNGRFDRFRIPTPSILRCVNLLWRKLEGLRFTRTRRSIVNDAVQTHYCLTNFATRRSNCTFGLSHNLDGGSIIIPCPYCLIVHHKRLGTWLLSGTMLVALVAGIFNTLIFHVGSKPCKLSSSILQYAVICRRSSVWNRRFFRSCPVIAIRIGGLHKLSRKRGPDFFRFMLKRTAFLVAKKESDCGLFWEAIH